MCGIAGIVDFAKQEDHREALGRMLDAVAHRGPDDRGLETRGPCSLGHVRLAIIDLSASGHQPMSGADPDVLVVSNGEIYNYRELRRELEAEGVAFRSRSDTETIVRLYERLGDASVDRLRGMFALALWDGPRRRLLLARDPLGKKPLYYTEQDGKFAFCSEIAPLLELPWVSREINPRAVAEFWRYRYNPGDATFFAAIRQLPPGHMACVEPGGTRLTPGWKLPSTDATDLSFEEASREFERRLDLAVQRRLLSDVPVGAFLSGGLDSSCIVALMSRHVPRVKTFTVAFPGTGYDESREARAFAERYGTEHTEVRFEEIRFDRGVLDVVVDHCGEPFGDSSALPTYFITRSMREHVTVALSGDGGDEVLAGYHTNRWLERIDRFSFLPAPILNLGSSLCTLTARLPGLRGSNLLRQAGKGLRLAAASAPEKVLGAARFLTDAEMAELFRTPRTFLDTRRSLPPALRGFADDGDVLLAAQRFDILQKLPGDMLVKMDRMSMANAFEVRCPFLDRDLVEWTLSLPLDYRYRNGETKRLLRAAFADELGAETLSRPKTGFSVSLSAWRNAAMVELGRELLDPERIRRQGLYNPDAVQRILHDFLDPDSVPAARLSLFQVETRFWMMIVFQRWYQKYVEGTT